METFSPVPTEDPVYVSATGGEYTGNGDLYRARRAYDLAADKLFAAEEELDIAYCALVRARRAAADTRVTVEYRGVQQEVAGR